MIVPNYEISYTFNYGGKQRTFYLDSRYKNVKAYAMFQADRMINHCVDGYWKLTDVDKREYTWTNIYDSKANRT